LDEHRFGADLLGALRRGAGDVERVGREIGAELIEIDELAAVLDTAGRGGHRRATG